MDAIINEIANRAWLYSESILGELTEKDKGDEELSVDEKRLLDFISRFKAGSLFLDLFQEHELNKLVENVFRNQSIQTFVFDLRWQATVGMSKAELERAFESIAYTLAPGFQRPETPEFRNEERHALLNAMDQLDFVDHKWKLTYNVIIATLRFMPWLVPLMLISVGGLYGQVANGSD